MTSLTVNPNDLDCINFYHDSLQSNLYLFYLIKTNPIMSAWQIIFPDKQHFCNCFDASISLKLCTRV